MRVSNPQPAEFVLGAQMRAVILTRGAETDGRHDLVEAVQQPGTTTPLHLHTRYDERLWVIEGEITAWVGEHEYRVGAGGLVTIPMTTPHMIKAGPRGVRALNISSPAGFAELIERAAVPAAQAGPGTELDVDRSCRSRPSSATLCSDRREPPPISSHLACGPCARLCTSSKPSEPGAPGFLVGGDLRTAFVGQRHGGRNPIVYRPGSG